MTELSDELLVAYVDGQLARDQSRAIKRVLDNDEVAAARVEALRATQKRLEAAFDAMLADEFNALTGTSGEQEGVSPPAQQRNSRSIRGRKWPAIAAGIAFTLLAAGVWAPYFVPLGELLPVDTEPKLAADPVVTAALRQVTAVPELPKGPGGWLGDMAAGHALLARETLDVSPASQGNADLARFQLAKAIDPTLVIPDLSRSGLAFRRAQLLRSEGERVAEIAYLPETGPPVALYARAGGAAESPFTFDEAKGTMIVSWDQNGVSYVLAGLMAKAGMERLVATIYDQVAAAANEPAPEISDHALPEDTGFVPAIPGVEDLPAQSEPAAAAR